MGGDVRTINWLEVAAWIGLTVLLLTALGAALRHVWAANVRRIEALEKWRERHEADETNMLLEIRDLQNETKHHTEILERMERLFESVTTQLGDLALMVGAHRRRDIRPGETPGGLGGLG